MGSTKVDELVCYFLVHCRYIIYNIVYCFNLIFRTMLKVFQLGGTLSLALGLFTNFANA